MMRLSGRLHVRWSVRENTDADAPTLVLLHGITNSGAGWVDAVRRWSSHYRIAAVDALGHGESDRFTDAELAGDGLDTAIGAIEALVTTTIEALESIVAASGPVVLVGHSMGGSTASVIAGRRPDLLRGAVLEDPAWEEPSVAMWGPRGAQWLARAHADRLDPAASIAGELNDPELLWPRDEIQPWIVAHTQVDDRFVVLGRTEQPQLWPQIAAAIATPTLLVTGTNDVIVDKSMRTQLAEIANPLLKVSVIEDAGHSVRRDRGNAFHALVDPWIARRFAG